MGNSLDDNQDGSLVSILIPTYNRPEKTIRAVYSALQQTYSDIEVVVTDNSDDNRTKDLLESICNDERVKYYKNDGNIGLLNNWKKALNIAKGSFVKILFSDDWMDSSFCNEAIRHFKNNPLVTSVFSNVVLRTNEKDVLLYSFDGEKSFTLEEYFTNLVFKSNLSLSPGNFIFRREAIQFKDFYYDDILNGQVNDTGAGADILLILSSLVKKNTVAIALPFYYNFFESKDDSITLNKWSIVSSVYNNCLYQFIQECDISNKKHISETLLARINGKNYKLNFTRFFLDKIKRQINFIAT